jgi:HAD superfamily hydrolase (TIGR01509 family)
VAHEPVTAVVFDIGGVLVSHVRSWREAHERVGFEWDPFFDSEEFVPHRSRLANLHQVGEIEPADYFVAVAEASGGRYSPTDAELIVRNWLYGEYPGVHDVLDALHAAGVTTAALSNTNPVHWQQMAEAHPSVWRLHHRHASHLLRARKPERAIFEAFERETGIMPEGVLFFEDTPHNIEAAQAFGWRAELIDHAGDTAAQLFAHLRRYGVIRD